MIKTFLRRWYVINRLYSIRKKYKKAYRKPDKIELIFWVLGTDLRSLPTLTDKDSAPRKRKISPFIFWLFEEDAFDDAYKSVEETIEDCQSENTNLIVKPMANYGYNYQMKLTAKGREQYGLTYLIFGHEYARKLWMAVMFFIVALLIINQMEAMVKANQTKEVVRDGYYLQVEEFRRWVR